MSRIQARFEALARAGRKALIPYITAGDPHPSLTVPLMRADARQRGEDDARQRCAERQVDDAIGGESLMREHEHQGGDDDQSAADPEQAREETHEQSEYEIRCPPPLHDRRCPIRVRG